MLCEDFRTISLSTYMHQWQSLKYFIDVWNKIWKQYTSEERISLSLEEEEAKEMVQVFWWQWTKELLNTTNWYVYSFSDFEKSFDHVNLIKLICPYMCLKDQNVWEDKEIDHQSLYWSFVQYAKCAQKQEVLAEGQNNMTTIRSIPRASITQQLRRYFPLPSPSHFHPLFFSLFHLPPTTKRPLETSYWDLGSTLNSPTEVAGKAPVGID